MASIGKVSLVKQVNIAANTITDPSSLTQNSRSFIGFLKAENYVAGTYNVTLEHSGNGTDWETLASFAALSADGAEYVQITSGVLPQVRANIQVTGGDAEITVDLFFDPSK